MKVRVDQTIEVSEDRRRQIVALLDGKDSKRRATREEAREFIWRHGRDWEDVLDRAEEFHAETQLRVPGERDEDEQLSLDDLL